MPLRRLCAWQFIEHVERLKEENLLAENGLAYATHIAHEGNPVHPEPVEFAAQYGYRVAHDGLSI